VASETDAARDRVIAARAELAGELEILEASARAAVDIPARIKRSPAKVAAVAGGVGFLALKGPQRLFGAAKRAVRGPSKPLPDSMLPDEVERTLRSLGSDGDRIRGVLERDFADYAKASAKKRKGVSRGVLMAVATPFLTRGAKAAAEAFMRPDGEGFAARLTEVRARAEQEIAKARDAATSASNPSADDEGSSAGA
jgi:hypothetical protein